MSCPIDDVQQFVICVKQLLMYTKAEKPWMILPALYLKQLKWTIFVIKWQKYISKAIALLQLIWVIIKS